MKRVLICVAFAMLTLGLAASLNAICITPEQLRKAASDTAKNQAHQDDGPLPFLEAILALLSSDIKTEFDDNDSWQKLDPNHKDPDYKHSDADWAKLVLKRAEFWASDGEIVVAVKGDDVALLVPTPTENQTDTVGNAWEGFKVPYAAHSSRQGAKPTAGDKLSKIFDGARPKDFIFYRYKK